MRNLSPTRWARAFSLFSSSFRSCRSRSSLSGNCCASEHELLVTVDARGSDPGTVTGVTWLLSSFSLRAGPSTLLSSSPPLCEVGASGGRGRVARHHRLRGVQSRRRGGLGSSFRVRRVREQQMQVGSRRLCGHSRVQRKRNHPASRFTGRRRLQAP